MGPGRGRFFMSVEEEIEMLEKAKEHLEAQLKNIDERLEKLKA
jgi:chaperonin cofactor prefoldin